MQDSLTKLARGFRQKYLAYELLTEQLQVWHQQFPEVTRLSSLGRSAEGREIWCLLIGRDPDETKPAAWVDGNMHASKLCGSNVALAIAEDLLRLHLGLTLPYLPRHLGEWLKDVHVFVVPRISPDGAETVLRTGRFVRSSPVDDRQSRGAAHWRSADLDGDGFIGKMRVRHPDGEMVESKTTPGLMLQRRIEDEGPYFKVYPEGFIENFDGRNVPDPFPLSDNRYDLNRTFPWSWAPEHIQVGAGDYPGALPETRAILEFTRTRPNIHVWMNYHTYGGVFIRPPGDKPDTKLDQRDLAIFRELEQWAQEFTSYPTVGGFEDFIYEPDTPIRGDLADYAYHQRGAMAVVCELWDLFAQLGMARTKPFVKVYAQITRDHLESLAVWDRAHNAGRIFRPWRTHQHQQLGPVEIGGYDARIGIWNPPYERIDEICRAQSAVFLRMASLVPRPVMDEVSVQDLGNANYQLDVRVRNAGYLATFGMPSAKNLPFSEPLRLYVKGEDAETRLIAPTESIIEVGHLEGWGRGQYGGDFTLGAFDTQGSSSERVIRLVVQGKGQLTLTLSSPRVGQIETVVRLP